MSEPRTLDADEREQLLEDLRAGVSDDPTMAQCRTASEAMKLAAELLTPSSTGMVSAEVRLNDDGTLDEVVTKAGDQLEQMDYNHWFLQIGDVAVWLHAKGKITASYERRPVTPSATTLGGEQVALLQQRIDATVMECNRAGYTREGTRLQHKIDGLREALEIVRPDRHVTKGETK